MKAVYYVELKDVDENLENLDSHIADVVDVLYDLIDNFKNYDIYADCDTYGNYEDHDCEIHSKCDEAIKMISKFIDELNDNKFDLEKLRDINKNNRWNE